MLKEIYAQGFANSAVLAIPCILLAADDSAPLSALEIAGFCVWALGWTIESIADMHKLHWLTLPKATRGSYCNHGLWK
jgi:steroid 5-alpha reductase family enzyme